MNYTLRRSARARRILIRVSPQFGVELVVPAGVSEARATGFLNQRLDWVRRVQAGFPQLVAPKVLPATIELPAFGLSYGLERGGERLLQSHDRLQLPLAWGFEQAAAALCAWLQQQARQLLPAYCEARSRACGLGFERLRVGLQASRWGSYSGRGTLSLNAKLLLMPEPLLRYVVHHELSHSLHMNHSAAFWNALAVLEPEWRLLRRRLRDAGPELPVWVRHRRSQGQGRTLPD